MIAESMIPAAGISEAMIPAAGISESMIPAAGISEAMIPEARFLSRVRQAVFALRENMFARMIAHMTAFVVVLWTCVFMHAIPAGAAEPMVRSWEILGWKCNPGRRSRTI